MVTAPVEAQRGRAQHDMDLDDGVQASASGSALTVTGKEAGLGDEAQGDWRSAKAAVGPGDSTALIAGVVNTAALCRHGFARLMALHPARATRLGAEGLPAGWSAVTLFIAWPDWPAVGGRRDAGRARDRGESVCDCPNHWPRSASWR